MVASIAKKCNADGEIDLTNAVRMLSVVREIRAPGVLRCGRLLTEEVR